jgi:hypothetical protein
VEWYERWAATFAPSNRVIACWRSPTRPTLNSLWSKALFLPDGLDLVDAAAIPLVVLTGDQLIKLAAHAQSGQTIIVSGISYRLIFRYSVLRLILKCAATTPTRRLTSDAITDLDLFYVGPSEKQAGSPTSETSHTRQRSVSHRVLRSFAWTVNSYEPPKKHGISIGQRNRR